MTAIPVRPFPGVSCQAGDGGGADICFGDEPVAVEPGADTGAASTLTDPGVLASHALTPATAVAVLSGYAAVLLAASSRLVLRRDVA